MLTFSFFSKLTFAFLVFLMACASVRKPQENKITYVDLNEGFPYLDENYRIQNVTTQLFDSIVNKYNFYPERITRYNDSLAVIFILKHQGDWSKQRKEFYRVTFTWNYLCHYFLLSPEQTQALGEQVNVRFRSDLLYYFDDDGIVNKLKSDHIARIRQESFRLINDSSVFRISSNKELLRFAFNIGAQDRANEGHRKMYAR